MRREDAAALGLAAAVLVVFYSWALVPPDMAGQWWNICGALARIGLLIALLWCVHVRKSPGLPPLLPPIESPWIVRRPRIVRALAAAVRSSRVVFMARRLAQSLGLVLVAGAWWVAEDLMVAGCSAAYMVQPWPVAPGEAQCSSMLGYDLGTLGLLVGAGLAWFIVRRNL